MSRHSTFAQESLAGLAAKVDFSAVKLEGSRQTGSGSWQPYRTGPMLLRLKGRRHVQTRLVPPTSRTLNAGDCFVLVCGSEVGCPLTDGEPEQGRLPGGVTQQFH